MVVTDRGFIPVDVQMRTNVPHIFAIGDVVGQPMLAHKAVHEAHVAAEVAAGDNNARFDARVIPSVAYTDPEVAWVGLTEDEAKARGINWQDHPPAPHAGREHRHGGRGGAWFLHGLAASAQVAFEVFDAGRAGDLRQPGPLRFTGRAALFWPARQSAAGCPALAPAAGPAW